MAIKILMPKVSFIVTEGTLINWLKKPGDLIKKGEPLFQMESEKATIEIEALAEGILGENLIPPGTTVPITTVIGFLLTPGEACPSLEENFASGSDSDSTVSYVETLSAIETKPEKRKRIMASPSAKRLARELDVDLSKIRGTGTDGRIVQEDVMAFVETLEKSTPRITPAAKKLSNEFELDVKDLTGSGPGGRIALKDVELSLQECAIPADSISETEIVPMTGIQRVAAERMTASFTSAPHFYLSVQVDMSQVVAMRKTMLVSVEEKTHKRLSYTDILIFAVSKALTDHPRINSMYQDGQLKRFKRINIGLAIDTPRGLTVAVLHQVNQHLLTDITLNRARLVEKARLNQLGPHELSQGTFTVSNLGMFGIDHFNAIINPPQSAILAVGRIAKRPIVVDDDLALLPTMWMTLSVDHRAIDGAGAARFLQTLVGYLENPYNLLV